MPTYTLRLDEEEDKQYITDLNRLKKEFKIKSATETFKRCVFDYAPIKKRVNALEIENDQLRRELNKYREAVDRHIQAFDALTGLTKN